MTRGLTAVINQRAQWDTIHTTEEDALIAGWERLDKILDYLVGYLPDTAMVHSSGDLNTHNILIPIISYLGLSDGSFKSDEQRQSAAHWMHQAQMWGRYSAQTDSNLEEDLTIIRSHDNDPWPKLLNRIVAQRGRLKVTAEDLRGAGTSSRFYKITYALFKYNKARDWFNGLPLIQGSKDVFVIHSHHIFPKAMLMRNNWTETDDGQKGQINEIANRAFLTDDTNIKISDDNPEIYLPAILSNYPDALKQQLVPENPTLWAIEHFEEFLAQRRQLIADGINNYLSSLVSGDVDSIDIEIDIEDLISNDESETLEFKETWYVNTYQSDDQGELITDKKMQLSCIKTIAAMMNSSGGNLIIGVTDDNIVEGLDRDLELVQNNSDKLQRQIVDGIGNALGKENKSFYEIKMRTVDEKIIFQITVTKNEVGPTWVSFQGESKLYIREGNRTISLDEQTAYEYARRNWT